MKAFAAVEKEGKNVDEAIEAALAELGLTKENVDIEILDSGTKGFLGLLGKPARVRVEPKNKESFLQKAEAFLSGVLSRMGRQVEIFSRIEEDTIFFQIEGNNLGLLIGHRGQTLDALQYLVSLVLNREAKKHFRVVVDAENYRNKRTETLTKLALRLAKKVKEQKRKTMLEPMPPQDRRIIHATLQDDSNLITYSQGQEPFRRVIIAPKSEANNQN